MTAHGKLHARAAGSWAAGLAAVCIAASCGGAETPYLGPEALARIRCETLREASGIAASRRQAGVFWVHNDSGGTAEIFAIDDSGRLLAVVEVAGALAVDWEEIAIGPGPEKAADYLYVADTGNNLRDRKSVRVYRFPEPQVLGAAAPAKVATAPAEAWTFSFPDGALDCEAMVVHPSRPIVYLFTKQLLGVGVYQLSVDGAPTVDASARKLAQLAVGSFATAAALSSDGRRLALRFYWGICEYTAPEGELVVDRLARSSPVWIKAPPEPQGEALTYSPEGTALYTVSEGPQPMLYRLRQAEPRPAVPVPCGGGDAGRP